MIRKLLKFLNAHMEEVVVTTLLLFLVFSINIEVVRRYVFHNSSPYTEEIARFAMIWAVFIGVGFAIREKRHITADIFPASLPKKFSLAIDLFSYVCFFGFSIIMVIGCYELVISDIQTNRISDAMQLPMWYFHIASGIGFTLAIFRLIQALCATIVELKNEFISSERGGNA